MIGGIIIPDIYKEVLNNVNIVDVMNYYGINVSKGNAICPFHADHSPSMKVDDKKNLFHCFPCGAGGNTLTFVKKYETEINHNPISSNDALIKIAEICNLKIDLSKLKKNQINYQYTTTARKYNKEEQSLIEVNNYMAKLFNYNLTAVRDAPLKYLKDRGLTDEIIKEMNIGFAPKGQIIRISENNDPNAKIKPHQLTDLGLIQLGDNGYYETFVDRIMFPICDEKGNVITFAGRTIKDEEPKYLHTKETPIFHKKELLYNYYDAKKYSYNDELYIVEGYMDVISAKQLGFNNVVALMGTAITEEHINLLKKNNSTLVLALDNDFKNDKENIGRKKMIEQIPNLLKQGFKVDVLDISRLGNYKDFGDIGKDNIPKQEIVKARMSAFEFMMDYYYFKDKELSVLNIHDIYEKTKKDEFITSTLDESLYKEYLLKKTNFTKEELDEIIYPKNISTKINPISNFQSIVMDDRIKNELAEFLNKRNDKVLSGYYELKKEQINNEALRLFHLNSTKYLSKNAMKLNTALLIYDVLNNDNEYSKYETLHRFKYEDLFDKTYIKNINGSAKVNLTFEQKQQVIKQYEKGLSDKDKLALEEVEELYIINDTKDLDGILVYDNDIMKLFKENIQDRLFLNPDNMDFFKYGCLFLNINKEFISNEFKGKTGNYKTILFFNNLDGKMKLEKEQLTKENVLEQNSLKKEIHKEQDVNKDYVFSINQTLLNPSFETNTHYFVRIPNTGAKDYFYIPKNECNWSGEIIFTKLKSGNKYKVYNKHGNYKYEKSAEELKHYWEDKTSKKNNVFESKNSKEEKKEEIPADETIKEVQPFIPQKEPVCKVFKSRIFKETDNGYYVKTNDKNILLFIMKKICKWNQDNSYLIVHPKKNFLTGTGISKYKFDGEEKTYEKRLAFNEITEYLSVFYPASYKKGDKETIKVPKTNCEYCSNFIKIPINIDNIIGYISINLIKCKDDKENIILELSKNEQLSFYTKEGNYVGNYGINDIRKGLSKKDSKVIPFTKNDKVDFNKLINSFRDITYKSGLDRLEFKTATIEPDYECFETVVHVKLNDVYLYKPEGRNVAPYRNELVQNGMFKTSDEVVAFLTTFFQDKELTEVKDKYLEKEVS